MMRDEGRGAKRHMYNRIHRTFTLYGSLDDKFFWSSVRKLFFWELATKTAPPHPFPYQRNI